MCMHQWAETCGPDMVVVAHVGIEKWQIMLVHIVEQPGYHVLSTVMES